MAKGRGKITGKGTKSVLPEADAFIRKVDGHWSEVKDIRPGRSVRSGAGKGCELVDINGNDITIEVRNAHTKQVIVLVSQDVNKTVARLS